MIRLVRLLGLRELRRHRLRALLAVGAIGAGLALTYAVAAASASIQHATSGLNRGLSGSVPIRLRGALSRGGIGDATVATVAGLPGVKTSIPVVQTVAMTQSQGNDEPVVALGVDCSIEAVFGDFGCDPELARTATDVLPFVSSSFVARRGPSVTLRTDRAVLPLRHAPTLPALDSLNGGRVVVFPLGTAQNQFLRQGSVDAIYVQPLPGHSVDEVSRTIRRSVGPQVVVERSTDPLPGAKGLDFLVILLGMVGLVAASIGALLVYNLARLSATERRRHLAIASAVGVPSRIMRTAILTEAVAVGAAGGLLGALVGRLVASPVVGGLSHELQRSIGLAMHVHVPLILPLLSIAAGALLAAAAVVPVARRASRADVVADLHRGDVDPGAPPAQRLVALALPTVVALAGALAGWFAARNGGLNPLAPVLAYAGIVAACGGFLLAVPAWAGLLLRSAARLLPAGRGGMAGTAVTALSRQARRAGLMTAAIAGAVALSAGLGNFLPATRAGLTRSIGQLADGRVYVNSVPPNNSFAIDSKLSADAVVALRARPDVSRVDRNFYLGVDDATARFAIVAYESLTRDFTVYSGRSSGPAFARDEIMIGAGLARARHLHPGDTLTIPTASGRVVRRIGGIWASPTNQGKSVTMSPTAFVRLFGDQPPQAVFVSPTNGLSANALATRLRSDKSGAGLHVLTSDQYVKAVADDIGRYLQPFWVLQRLFLLLALVSTLTTLVLAAVQTTRERAILSAVGVGPRGLYRMVVVEGTTVGSIGALLGVIGAALLTVSLSMVAGILFGLRPPIRIAPISLASSALFAIVVVALGTLGPAALSARSSPVEGLRYE